MKHYKSVEFLSIFRMPSPFAERQSPPIEKFLATVLVESQSLTKKVCILRITGYTIDFIIWSQWCKERFIVHFTFQWWFNPLSIYKRFL